MTIQLHAGDRWQAIDELINHLEVTGQIDPQNREPIVAAIRRREMSMSTAIGLGTAIPHAFSNLVSKAIEITGRSEKGIDFGALDGQPVYRVFLVLVPKGEFQKFFYTLTNIAKRLHDPDFL